MGSTASQLTIAPYLAILLLVVCLAWIFAVRGLSKQYNALIAERGEN
jgi:ATP/ADP translocase